MAYQVTHINTPQADNPPAFDDWVETLDSSVMSNYPDYSDPSSVLSSFVPSIVYDAAQGFISETVTTDDNGVTTLVQLWESQADYDASINRANYSDDRGSGYLPIGNINCQTDSVTVTGIDTQFLTDLKSGDIIQTGDASNDNLSANIGTIASISSDTELTLTSNAVFNVDNQRFGIEWIVSPLAYLRDLYNQTYPVTTTATFANV